MSRVLRAGAPPATTDRGGAAAISPPGVGPFALKWPRLKRIPGQQFCLVRVATQGALFADLSCRGGDDPSLQDFRFGQTGTCRQAPACSSLIWGGKPMGSFLS